MSSLIQSPPTSSPKQTAADQEVSVSVSNFNLWYGSFQALKDVTLDFKKGIITSMIGPSGCGKTTLLRSFNRINERYGNVTTTGSIRILGKNILDPDVSAQALRKSVGMVFSGPIRCPFPFSRTSFLAIAATFPPARLPRPKWRTWSSPP